MQDKPITIRALFGDEMLVSYHRSVRREENWRYQARELADMACQFGAQWAQGWIAGQRVCWLVSQECQEDLLALGYAPEQGRHRLTAEQTWAALEGLAPAAAVAPPPYTER